MTIEELEIEIQNKLGNEDFSLNDALSNPETYGLSQFDVDGIQDVIENNDELSEEQSEKILGLFKTQDPINTTNRYIQDPNNPDELIENPNYTPPTIGQKDEEERYIQRRDDKGDPVFTSEGYPDYVKINTDTYEMMENVDIFNTFLGSLTRADKKLIQDLAVEMGYIDIQDFGREINGVGGAITSSLINEVLKYINLEYQEWFPGSKEKNTLIEKISGAHISGGFYPEINEFYGGVDFSKSDKLADSQIIAKEVFANGLLSFLTDRKTTSAEELKTFDRQRAKEIKRDFRVKTKKEYMDILEDTAKAAGKDISDALKSEIADEIIAEWSPYTRALIAQDKHYRASEVYDYYKMEKEEGGWNPLTGEKEEDKYVRIDAPEGRLKPAFYVQNPEEKAVDELEEGWEADDEHSQNYYAAQKAQEEYLRFLSGR